MMAYEDEMLWRIMMLYYYKEDQRCCDNEESKKTEINDAKRAKNDVSELQFQTGSIFSVTDIIFKSLVFNIEQVT